MQKRSHWLLASALLQNYQGFSRRRFEWAFLLGSCQPDCNPLSYLKGSLRGRFLRGHDFSNSHSYLITRIRQLRRRTHWNLWHYYTLGKLTHYLADAFTYPHNAGFPTSFTGHRPYERALRLYLKHYLSNHPPLPQTASQNPEYDLYRLHQQYSQQSSDIPRDVSFILQGVDLLMGACAPAAAFPKAHRNVCF